MSKLSFLIVIPNYNNAQWLDNCFSSIYAQTNDYFYSIIFIDDCSTDNSIEIAEKWSEKFCHSRWGVDFDIVKNEKKKWNGGSRNAARESWLWNTQGYIIFLDSDDWFADSDCLKAIGDALEQNNYPDLLRLSYCILVDDHLTTVDMSDQKTIERIVSDQNVACWTKCVKTEKLAPFPENTLMEDVVQHIKQLDNVETVASISKGIVVWNRNNKNSCSRDETLQNGKWKSSLYRYYADLLDLEVNKPECKAELERRRKITLENIKNDRFIQ